MSLLPTIGKPGVEVIGWPGWEIHQQLHEVEMRVHVMAAAAAGQAGQDRRSSPTAGVAHEEGVFFCYDNPCITARITCSRARMLAAGTRRRDLQPDRHRQTQRHRSRSLLARCAHAHRRSPHQPHRKRTLTHRLHATGLLPNQLSPVRPCLL